MKLRLSYWVYCIKCGKCTLACLTNSMQLKSKNAVAYRMHLGNKKEILLLHFVFCLVCIIFAALYSKRRIQ